MPYSGKSHRPRTAPATLGDLAALKEWFLAELDKRRLVGPAATSYDAPWPPGQAPVRIRFMDVVQWEGVPYDGRLFRADVPLFADDGPGPILVEVPAPPTDPPAPPPGAEWDTPTLQTHPRGTLPPDPWHSRRAASTATLPQWDAPPAPYTVPAASRAVPREPEAR